MKKIAKPHYTEHALYYEQYINEIANDTPILKLLKDTAKEIEQLFLATPEEKLCSSYAEGKWSMKDILVHLMDCERIFIYRAMRFARNDKTPLPFFEENDYAKEANANTISTKKLLKEYKAVRNASIVFFNNLDAKTLKRQGMASNFTMSVRACAWIIASHEQHHLKIIKKRYL